MSRIEIDEEDLPDFDVTKVFTKFRVPRQELIWIFLVIGLCVLVVGLTVKYNVLVKEYNHVVDEVNECRQKEQIGIIGGDTLEDKSEGEGWRFGYNFDKKI